MTRILQKITTEFISEEDRLRLAGVTEDEQTVVIWLTRRLLGLMLPVVLRGLESGSSASSLPEHQQMIQEFAQQAATQALAATPSAPVRTQSDSDVFLATSVDISQIGEGVMLAFRDEAGNSARLPLTDQALRQWLQILYRADRIADWQLPQWPAWVAGEVNTDFDVAFALH